MDNLARNAMLARQANMSYGKWKAMQEPVKIAPKSKLPEGWIRCEWCRTPFKLKTKRLRKYCDIGCQRQAYLSNNREKHNAYAREYRARKEKENA